MSASLLVALHYSWEFSSLYFASNFSITITSQIITVLQRMTKSMEMPPERIELSTPSLLDWCSNHWAMEADDEIEIGKLKVFAYS